MSAAREWQQQADISRASEQIWFHLHHPGRVAVTNNAYKRPLHPAVVQRKVTNNHRARWTAAGEAHVRTVVGNASPKEGWHLRSIPKTVHA